MAKKVCDTANIELKDSLRIKLPRGRLNVINLKNSGVKAPVKANVFRDGKPLLSRKGTQPGEIDYSSNHSRVKSEATFHSHNLLFGGNFSSNDPANISIAEEAPINHYPETASSKNIV